LQRKRARQELAEAEAMEVDPPSQFDSELAAELIRRWAWGKASAAEVQRLAAMSHRDQQKALTAAGAATEHASRSLLALAALGNSGRHPNNCNRDLKAWLGEPDTPAPTFVAIPCKIQKPRGRLDILRPTPLPFLLPHNMIAYLYNSRPDDFVEKFLGPDGTQETLADFWTEIEARGDPRLLDHPMCKRTGWKSKAIPIALHGDAVPVIAVGKAGTQSMDNLSWQSLLARGPTMTVKFLAFSMFEKSKTATSMDEVWRVLLWSFTAAFRGCHPGADWHGKRWPAGSSEAILAASETRIAGGFFFVIWSIKGDLDWYAKGLGLKSYNANDPCEFCPCSKDGAKGLWPMNFGPTCAWKNQLHTRTSWRASNPDMHLLFKSFSFLSCLNIEADELHVLHLGVSQYFLGSVLWLLVYVIMAGTPAQNIQRVWELILEKYTEQRTPTQFSALQLSSFINVAKHNTEYPRLKGKAAEIKHLALPLLHAWKLLKRRSAHDQRVTACLEALLEIHDRIDEHARDAFMTRDSSAALCQAVNHMLDQYSWLGVQADRNGHLLFTAAPKLHWLWHLSRRSIYMSPRRGACYIDEDFMKHMKGIAARCTSGVKLHMVPRSLMSKYRWGVMIEGRLL